MAWRKSPPELIAVFEAALPPDRRVERRSMFGYPCAFARGNMFTGLHQESLIVRLPEVERARLLREPGASIFEPMPGRQMREYVAVPPDLVADAAELREWMTVALDYAASLPPKARRGAARAGQEAPGGGRAAGATRKGSRGQRTPSKVKAPAKVASWARAKAAPRSRGR